MNSKYMKRSVDRNDGRNGNIGLYMKMRQKNIKYYVW